MPELTLGRETRRALLEALRTLPSIESEMTRARLVSRWPPALRANADLTGPPGVVLSSLLDLALRRDLGAAEDAPPLTLLVSAAQELVHPSQLETRLGELLAQACADLGWDAPTAPGAPHQPLTPGPQPPFRVPYPRNPLFVGREAELAQIAAALDAGATPVITGAGGMGKSQLAVEAAYRGRDRFPGGVFWLNMADPAGVATEVAACAGPDGLALPGWEPGGFERNLALVKAAWQEPSARLLVFDNLEDPALLTEWRPRVGGCRVLVTSRRQAWPAAAGVEPLPLAPLARVESVHLLLAPRARRRGTTVDALRADAATAQAADAICAELGDLPLALALAGAYLETLDTLPLDRYVARLRQDLLAHRSLSQAEQAALPTGHTPSLAVTFAASYLYLDERHATDALALRLLHRAAHCAPGVLIPRRLLLRAAELDPDGADAEEVSAPALHRLAALGLIDLLPEGDARLHRLLAAYARSRAPDLVGDQAAVEEVLSEEAAAINNAGTPLEGRPYLDHLRQAVQVADPRGDGRAATLLNNLAELLRIQGEHDAARPLYEHALTIREEVLGPSHPDTITSLNNLAELLRAEGEYDAARPLYERALTIREGALGPSHPDTATSLNNLAGVLRDSEDYGAARLLYERALAIREQTHGPEHLDTARSLNGLALLWYAQEQYEMARQLFERALAIREQALGSDHPHVARTLNHLGKVLVDLGDYQTARLRLERALAIAERTLGPNHPATAQCLDNLGYLLRAQGEYEAARPLFKRAVAICEQKLGPDHRNTRLVQRNLARLPPPEQP